LRQRLEQLRDWLNAHTSAAYGGAAALLLLAMVWWAFGGSNEGKVALPEDLHVSTRYFFDLTDKRVFVDRSDKYPPFENAAGHECVSAVIYGCGSCDKKHMYIAYYEKFTSHGQSLLEHYRSFNLAYHHVPTFGDECLVSATGEEGTWHPSTSPEGQQVVMSTIAKCTQHVPLRCKPEMTVKELEAQQQSVDN